MEEDKDLRRLSTPRGPALAPSWSETSSAFGLRLKPIELHSISLTLWRSNSKAQVLYDVEGTTVTKNVADVNR